MTDQIELSPRIVVPPEQIEAFCRRNHIRKLALFGSILTDDFNNDSDIDVLVEFEEGQTPDFFRFIKMCDEFSLLYGGRPVDMVTYRALKPHLRESVFAEAQIQFEDFLTAN